MTIVVVCQFCRVRYRFRDDSAGQTITCEHCGDVFYVPHPSGNGSLPIATRQTTEQLPSATLRELGPPRPVDPKRNPFPKDPTRPAVSDMMFKVGIGLKLVFLDAVLSGLIYTLLTVGPMVSLPQFIGPMLKFRMLAALQLTWVGVMAFGMLGRALCLLVPSESQAKPYILTSVMLEFSFMLITIASLFGDVPPEARVVGQITQLLGHVLFLGFLRRLAMYLRREDLLDESQKSFALGAVFVVAALFATLSRFFSLFLIAQLFFVSNVIVGPMLFFPYVRLLKSFHRAVRDLQ